jgi:hypothetical protein
MVINECERASLARGARMINACAREKFHAGSVFGTGCSEGSGREETRGTRQCSRALSWTMVRRMSLRSGAILVFTSHVDSMRGHLG